MYDQKLSYWDYLVLQNDDQACKITSFTDISDSMTSSSFSTNSTILTSTVSATSSCWKNSYSSETWKCSCKTWYTWEFPDISNNYDCKIKPTVCNDTKNGFLWTDNKCYCNTWYSLDTSTNLCKKSIITKIKCKKWELKRNGKCVSASSIR